MNVYRFGSTRVWAAAVIFVLAAAALWSPVQSAGASLERRSNLRSVQAARAAWLEQRPERYRLEISRSSDRPWDECRLVAHVAGDADVTIVENTCVEPLQVSDLFDHVERMSAERPCGPNGCECDGVAAAEVTYDPVYAYPARIREHLHRDWTTVAHPLSMLPPFGYLSCTQIGTRRGEIEIRVTPL